MKTSTLIEVKDWPRLKQLTKRYRWSREHYRPGLWPALFHTRNYTRHLLFQKRITGCMRKTIQNYVDTTYHGKVEWAYASTSPVVLLQDYWADKKS